MAGKNWLFEHSEWRNGGRLVWEQLARLCLEHASAEV